MAHPDTFPISFTYAPLASMWVVTLHSLFLYSDPPLPCHPSSCWLRLFSSQTFSNKNTSTFSNLVILHTYLPMKVEQTECSETLTYKIQTPVNYPEESIQLFICVKLFRLCLGPKQFPIQWVVWVVSLDVQQPGLKAGHSPPSSTEAENDWIYSSINPYVFMAYTLCFFTFTHV
jgi:hypothetical protein